MTCLTSLMMMKPLTKTYAIDAGATVQAGIDGTVISVDFTKLSFKSISALALKLVVQIQTPATAVTIPMSGSNQVLINLILPGRATGITQVGSALVDGGLTSQADKAGSTLAHKVVLRVGTGTTMLTRLGFAIVDPMLTLFAHKSRITDASKVIDFVNALAIAATRAGLAIINVDLTQLTGPSGQADATGQEDITDDIFATPLSHDLLVSEELVHTEAIDTLVLLAQVDLELASLASEAIGTLTGKVVDQVGTVGTQETGLLGTVVDVDLTVNSFPTLRTSTEVATLFKALALAIVLARVAILIAGINGQITVFTGVSGSAKENMKLLPLIKPTLR